MKIKTALIAAVLVLAALIGAIFLLEKRETESAKPETVNIGGISYERTVTELNFSGTDIWRAAPEELDKLTRFPQLTQLDMRDTGLTRAGQESLQAMLPDCRILWDPIFQGKAYPADTQTLSAERLTAEDVKQLADFPALKELDATGCRDYAFLRQLQTENPGLTVKYSVWFGDTAVSPDAQTLTLDNAGETEFALLAQLPKLVQVDLTGQLPQPEVLDVLAERYPGIAFRWEVKLLGSIFPSHEETLDLSGRILADTAELEAALPWFPALKTVNLCDCGLDTDVLGPLQERIPEIKFVWWMDLGSGNRIRTDATAFCAEPYGVKLYDDKLWQLKYCDRMVCLDLGHMPITDCSFVANMPDIKYLILAISRISDISPLANAEKLVFLEIFKTEVVDYTPLLNCKALEDLNVCGSIGAQWETLTQMPWLKRLYLGWDGTSMRTAQTIAEALPDTQVVLDPAEGSTGGDWRKGQHYFDMRDMLGKHYMEK